MNDFPRIQPCRTALLAIDMQNAFMLPGQVFGNPHACAIVSNVNRLASALRAAGGQVIWTRQTVSKIPPFALPAWQLDLENPTVQTAVAALSEGDPGHDLHQDLAIDAADAVLNKYRYSAFIQRSGIEDLLQARGIDTLIVAGTLTNVCCESSARDAYMLGYRILFASDATAAVTDLEHNAALLNLALNFADVRTTKELAALIAVNS